MLDMFQAQGSTICCAFGRAESLLKDDLLEPIDSLLEDETLIKLVGDALRKRRPLSAITGRRGIAPDRLLRLIVLKHLKCWSLRQLEREVHQSLVYRRFCRFYCESIPHFSSLSRQIAAVGESTVARIHFRVVEQARREKVAFGNKLRTDTTVVETNVHYPTDSTLLGDSVRVLTRSLKRIAEHCKKRVLEVRDRSRAVKHRMLEIHRVAKKLTDDNRNRLEQSYRKLLAITGAVASQAQSVVAAAAAGSLKLKGGLVTIRGDLHRLQHFLPLVQRVIKQTKARIVDGDTRYSDKLFSLFETHTQAIRKGKAHKPTEFGRLVRVDEIEGGIVSNFEVCNGNPSDVSQWAPALVGHQTTFGRPPRQATADRGYFSAKNEELACDLGVKRIALPASGRLGHARGAKQKQRWFRDALRFRAGVESRIATLKHRFGLARATYKGDSGLKRHIAWGIVVNNLVSIARAKRKKTQAKRRPFA